MKRLKHVGPVLIAGATAMLAVATAGCGSEDDLPREPISGRVTFDDAPLTKAWIEFRPEDTAGRTSAGAMIEGGSYSIARADGLVPGKYRVVISKAEAPDAATSADEGAPGPKGASKVAKVKKAVNPFGGFAKQLLPARYNSQTELKAEVDAGKANNFDFPLSSK